MSADTSSPLTATLPRALDLTVVAAETGQVIAGATVLYPVSDGPDRRATTDARGHVTLPLPQHIEHSFWIVVAAHSRVPTIQGWQGDADNRAGELHVPATHTFPLPRGTSIGGVVRDEAGDPIAGARLVLRYFRSERTPHPHIMDDPVTTGTDGRWRYDGAPADLLIGGRAIFDATLEHPDFMRKDRFAISAGDVPRLRNGTFTLTMTRGISLVGRVTDTEGRPIAGAEILRGTWELAGKVQTDADGRFTLPNCPPGMAVIIAKAAGKAPRQFHPDLKPSTPTMEIALSPAKALRVRVVDSTGKPILGAWVGSRQWRMTSLVNFSQTTGPDGLAEWNEAPDESIEVAAGKDGYVFTGHGTPMAPQDEPHIITLYRSAKVTGSIVDSQTAKPIEAFTAMCVVDWQSNGRQLSTARSTAVQCRHGGYELMLDRADVSFLVRVEAEGYRAKLSDKRWHISGGNAAYDFALAPRAVIAWPGAR